MKLSNLFAFGVASSMLLASCGGKKEVKTTPIDTTKTDTVAVDTTAKIPTVVNIVETAKLDSNLSVFVELLATAGLSGTLSDEGTKYTVFAPSNEAFNKLGEKKLASLKEEKNKEQLKDILTYHVVSGELSAAALKEKKELDALAEKVIQVIINEDKIMVGKAAVITADIKTSNGTIHIIDAVMTPPAKKSKTKTTETTTTTTTQTKTTTVDKNATVTETKTTEKKGK